MLPEQRTRIDARTRPSHKWLQPGDRAYYLGEYTPGVGYATPINDLIQNFKMKPGSFRRSPVRRRHKERAILEIATALTKHFSCLRSGAVVVPIPTSKLPGDPDYDDRLIRTLRNCKADPPLDVRELIKQKRSTHADHEATGRQSLRELLGNCYVDETLSLPRPSVVVLFDDVLTEGKHFKVCQRLLWQHYGEIPVEGFFVARTMHEPAKVAR